MAKARAMSRSKSARKMMDSGSLGGFTIIEVVLVLAIAGLIFMMVFIALPNLQRAQRDTQRRNALGELAAQIQQYQTNNNGRLPKAGKVDPQPEDSGELDMTSWCSGNSNKDNGAQCLIKGYLNSANDTTENKFADPDGWTYGLVIADSFDGNQPTGMNTEGGIDHTIYMYKKAKCNGETVESSTNPRNYAIWYKLEGNSSYCGTNAS